MKISRPSCCCHLGYVSIIWFVNKNGVRDSGLSSRQCLEAGISEDDFVGGYGQTTGAEKRHCQISGSTPRHLGSGSDLIIRVVSMLTRIT